MDELIRASFKIFMQYELMVKTAAEQSDKARVLSFDIGNSRIKWGWWLSSELLEKGASETSSAALKRLFEQVFGEMDEPDQVLAVCVAGEGISALLNQLVSDYWSQTVNFFNVTAFYNGRRHRLIHAYAQPQQHGADRWAGLIAASDLYGAPLCVIGAGTAITLDLLAADGRHLGGRILPSMKTMWHALHNNAANIAEAGKQANIEMNGATIASPPLFASNTQDAINSGIFYLLEAGLLAACEQAVDQLGADTKIIITGGFSSLIMANEKMPEMIVEPDLVLRGVYLALHSK